MSKERRVDPQVLVGMLVTPDGFPLEVHEFPGNTGETLTLLPVLRAFQDQHGVEDVVVVADAGMLSASNLNQIEDAGFSFIVGSRISKAPYDLAEHFDAHGGVLYDGSTMESKRVMGVGENARQRRVVYHYSAKRDRRDNHTLDKQVERAQRIADGKRPLKKDRFVKLTGTGPAVDQVLVDRARQLAGLKGYVTNIPAIRLTGNEVVAAYHELFQVERSFRILRNTFKFASRKYWDQIARSLRPVYTAPTEAATKARFEEFAEKWASMYPAIRKLWENAWSEFIPFLDYDVEIRRIICSTNAIESLNARYRRAVRARGHFPNDAAALKCLYLVTRSLDPTGWGRARWVTRWKLALNAFAITFDGRIN